MGHRGAEDAVELRNRLVVKPWLVPGAQNHADKLTSRDPEYMDMLSILHDHLQVSTLLLGEENGRNDDRL